MCHRISPLLIAELREALEQLRDTGHARVPARREDTVVPDVYPGKQLPLFVLDQDGQLQATELLWGFDAAPGSRSKFIFNTRIETALAQARTGHGLWAKPITCGRCLVPALGFYERWTQDPARRTAQVRFTLPGHRFLLMAGVCADGRVSIVTTSPNASVAPVHNRMPLVLGPGESSLWLGPHYEQLADRSGIVLAAQPELPLH